jgi:hypothetical protein
VADNGTNFSEDGKVAVWTKAEGSFEDAALDLNDTVAFQDEGALHVADVQSHSNHTVFGSEGLPRVAINRWVEFDAARELNDWKPDGIILTSFEKKDGSKMPSKQHIYAGADEDEFYPATAANAPEFIGQEKWQGNGKQGKESAARAKEAAQQSAPRGKGGKGNGGGGGWKARSGGATVASDEPTIEELKTQLLEQKAAATEARLKLLESQAAAKSTSQGWDV